MVQSTTPDEGDDAYDVIIIGVGLSGLYQLHRLLQAGRRVLAIEAGGAVGGVWNWNRYPGARLDSESYTYAYSFSKAIMEQWNWSEQFASQPELHRYYEHVATELNLKSHIVFNTLVTTAVFDETGAAWTLSTEAGARYRCRFLVTALGPLSAPTFPNIPGRESFRGESYHTSRWPLEPVELDRKKVAVVGTGATGIQVIQSIAPIVSELVVFQRTPQYAKPLKNRPILDEEQDDLKASYQDIISRCRTSNSWFVYDTDPRSIFELSEQEREAHLEQLYARQGHAMWKSNFHDVATDPAANDIVSDFVRRKIRERVKDPLVADRLTPKDHGFATRRVPLETNYFEVYNQPNVTLVSLPETPIVSITPTGIRTTAGDFEVDVIIYATGFDAITGSYDRIDIRGCSGASLRDKWREGPLTYLGAHTAGFPNLLMVGGPLASLGNAGPALEFSVDWVSDLLEYAYSRGITYIDVPAEAEHEWVAHAQAFAKNLLATKVGSWSTGVNTNVEGRDTPRVQLYIGSANEYRRRIGAERDSGYRSFIMKRPAVR